MTVGQEISSPGQDVFFLIFFFSSGPERWAKEVLRNLDMSQRFIVIIIYGD